jgi:hypothetical protein
MLYKRYPNRQRKYPRAGNEPDYANTPSAAIEGEGPDQLHRVEIPLPKNLGEPKSANQSRGLFGSGLFDTLKNRIQIDDIILIAIILLLLQEGIDDEILLLLLIYIFIA